MTDKFKGDRRRILLALLPLYLALLMPTAQGQVDQQKLLQLVDKQSFSAVTDETLSVRRQQLKQRLEELDQMLRRSRPGYRAGWHKFLHWETLQRIANDPKYFDAATLRRLVDRFTEDHTGLELKRFTAVREVLESYARLQLLGRARNSEAVFNQRLEQVKQFLPQVADADKFAEASKELASAVRWLVQFEQGQELAGAVQAEFSKPNVYASLSGKLLEESLELEVEDEQPVRDSILGTSIVGTAKTTGKLTLDVRPSNDSATIQLLFTGTANSNNRGFNRGVTIFSRGVTSIDARSSLVINDDGIVNSNTSAKCCTRTTITGLCARSKLVERIAWKQVYKSKPRAEAVASRKAERRVIDSLEGRAGDIVDDANTRYMTKFLHPLRRRGYPADDIRVASTNDDIQIALKQAARGQLAAPGVPAKIDGSHDMQVQLHESAITNFGEAAASGFKLTDKNLAEVLEQYAREVPEELKSSDTSWGITFAEETPIRVRFEQGLIGIAIRIASIQRAGRVAVRTLSEIRTTYKVTRTNEGILLERQGDVEVTPVGQKRVPASQIAAYKLVRSKFRALFKERIAREGFQFKGQLKDLGHFRLSSVASKNGWLSLAWRQDPNAKNEPDQVAAR